jgi:hypothetical protein
MLDHLLAVLYGLAGNAVGSQGWLNLAGGGGRCNGAPTRRSIEYDALDGEHEAAA